MPLCRHDKEYDFYRGCAFICGGFYAAIGFLVKIFSKSPHNAVHLLGIKNFIPPVWIFNLISLLFFFVSGCAAGIVIGKIIKGRARCKGEMYIYKGGIFFISLLFLTLIWYPLFFSGEFLFFSLIISLISLTCSILVACMWFYVNSFSCILISANCAWLFYVFCVNLLVILQN